MRQSLLYMALSAVFLLSACGPDTVTTEATSTALVIPELLQRSEAIRNGAEWDDAQRTYQKHSLALQQNPEAAFDALALVELFAQEARVTGEHGHYYPGALQLTDHVLALDDLDEDARFYALTLKSGVQLSQHEFAAALETGKEAVALRPQDAQAHGGTRGCLRRIKATTTKP